MTTTDITTREERAALATLDPAFVASYPALAADVDIRALMAETMGPGGELNLSNLSKVKVPTADFKSWLVSDDNGDDTMVKRLTGIPVALESRRSMWFSTEVTGSVPDCRSSDLETGIGAYGVESTGNPTGKCAVCPMAARGSAGTGTQASKCKEQRVLFLLTGDLLPVMVIIPPGSLPNFKNFGAFLFKKAIRGVRRPNGNISSAWLRLEIALELEPDTNPKGQDYNKATFRLVRRLTPDEVARVDAYGQWVDDLIVAQEDAVTAAAAGADEMTAVDVPFDADGLPLDEIPLDDEPTPTGVADDAGKTTAAAR